jgi:suppressor of G2 allele of SKP1
MEELYDKASHQYILGNYHETIKILESQSISDNSDCLFLRASSHISTKNWNKALEDINSTENLKQTSEVYYKKGLILFSLKEWIDSSESFKKSLQLARTNEQRAKLALWTNKLDIEIKENKIILLSGVESSSIKIIQNWYQSPSTVTVNLDSNTEFNNNEFKVNLERKKVEIKHNDNLVYSINLSNAINVTGSTFEINKKKLTLSLKKEIPDFNWVALDLSAQTTENAFKPSYPTSSKVKKNWDNLDKEIEKDLNKDVQGEDGMWKLFKEIYERGDENTRRAMIKSFQTSSGTVLSTNWGEVVEKDYEGRDRVEPPKGQDWAK